jgi:hypothetical protein
MTTLIGSTFNVSAKRFAHVKPKGDKQWLKEKLKKGKSDFSQTTEKVREVRDTTR